MGILADKTTCTASHHGGRDKVQVARLSGPFLATSKMTGVLSTNQTKSTQSLVPRHLGKTEHPQNCFRHSYLFLPSVKTIPLPHTGHEGTLGTSSGISEETGAVATATSAINLAN